MTRRPNFILISTDQQRADHVGSYGNQILQTPAIDSIAERGVSFDRFYVATPICMPNRATIMTGRMPSQHGVKRNGVPLRVDSTTMCDLLKAGGYRTALIGKSHLQTMTDLPPQMKREEGPGVLPPPELREERHDAWSEGRYDLEALNNWRDNPEHRIRGTFYGFDHVELCTMHGDLVHGDYYRWLAQRVDDPEKLRGPGNALPDNRYVAPQAYRTRVPEDVYPTRYIEERCLEWLDKNGKGDDRPFMLHCSFPDPHHPFTPPGHYWDMYDPDDIPAPASLVNRSLNDMTPPVRRTHEEAQANRNGTVAYAVDEREAREAIALTYGMIAMIDDSIARILARVDQLGLREDTVIIFTSDHGDFMGDHGLMLKAALHYQGLVRVPFIWSDPDHAGGPSRSDALCGSLDIARSILERAGLAPSFGMQGQSLMPVIRGDSVRAHDAVLIEEDGHAPAFGMKDPLRARSVITDRYRLSIYSPETWVELYDLQEDPLEMRNVADDPTYGAVRTAMFEIMSRKLMTTVDDTPFPLARA